MECAVRWVSGCSSLREVTLSPTLANIGGFAFCGCMSLSETTLPLTLTEIGGQAFYGCTSLSETRCRPPSPRLETASSTGARP